MDRVPEILTDRLFLRRPAPDDAQDIFEYASDPAVLLYTTARTPKSIEDTRMFVVGLVNAPFGAYAWAIRLRSAKRVIGIVEFGIPDGKNGTIHYALAKEYWNKGYITEACQAVLKWAFRSQPALERVTTSAMVANRGSTRVMEKCGMQYQTTVTEKWEKFDEPVRLAVYSISRERWQSMQPLGRAAGTFRLRYLLLGVILVGALLFVWNSYLAHRPQANVPLEVRLKDAGYSQVQLEGRMHLAFETSVFVPDGTKERWWLGWSDPAVSDAYGALERKAQNAERQDFWAWGRFDGWLSPPSPKRYGHLNSYAREFVVTRVLELKPSNQTNTAGTRPGDVPATMRDLGNDEPRG